MHMARVTGPIDNVGWGPFALPGERRRLEEAERKRIAATKGTPARPAPQDRPDSSTSSTRRRPWKVALRIAGRSLEIVSIPFSRVSGRGRLDLERARLDDFEERLNRREAEMAEYARAVHEWEGKLIAASDLHEQSSTLRSESNETSAERRDTI